MDRVLHELVDLLPLLLVGGVVYWVGLVAFTAWMMTHPPRRTYSWAVARGLPGDPSELDEPRDFTELTHTTSAGPVRVWRIPGDLPAGPVVVVTPGWSDSKLGALHRVPTLLPLAAEVIAWDPPGLGESPGRCLLGAREGRVLLELLDAFAGGRPVVLMGWSLGSGMSIQAAATGTAENQVLGVIAEAPYRLPRTPARAVMRLQRMPSRLNLGPALGMVGLLGGIGWRWRGFDRAEHAAKLVCPLLVLHGSEDAVSPLEDAEAIVVAARTAGADATLMETPGGQHNDLWLNPEFREQQTRAVREFLAGLVAPPPKP